MRPPKSSLDSAVNAAIGSLYRDGILAANTRLIHAVACKDPSWPDRPVSAESLRSYARRRFPCYLITSGVRLTVTYNGGRWSWERMH